MILGRNEFIREVYTPMIEEKEYKELQELNEGLLKNLFGRLKYALGFAGWKTIKGDSEIIRLYKEFDDKLTGFTTMKLSKAKQCDKIRQELVDFADTWYELKTKEDKKNLQMETSMEFEDENLKETLKTCKKNIEDIADGDNQMIKWSQLLTKNMINVINNAIKDDIEDEDVRKKIEKQTEEDEVKAKELNKKMEKLQNDELEEISKERKELIANAKSTPIDEKIYGDKAIQNICGEFKKITDTEVRQNNGKDMIDILNKDKVMGFGSIYTPEDITNNIDKFIASLTLTKAFYDSLNDRKVIDKFKETPGQSVQAMCIAVNSFIKNCVYGGNDYGKQIDLMVRCAIVSDGTVGFNLPLNDDEDNPGNFFTDTIELIASGKFGKTFIEKLEDTKEKIKNWFKNNEPEFDRNAKAIINKIKLESEKVKKDAQKRHEDLVDKLNDIEKSEN